MKRSERPLPLRSVFSVSIALGIALVGCSMSDDSDFDSAEDAVTAGTYKKISVRASGKCLDVNWGASANGTRIQQWSCNGGGAQSFRAEQLGSDANGRALFRLVNTKTGKCVDIDGAGTTDGTKIQLWECNGTAAQVFRSEPTLEGYERLINPNSSKCMDVNGSSQTNGAKVQIWNCNNTDAQNWKFEKLGSDGSGGSGGSSGSGGSGGGSSGSGGSSGGTSGSGGSGGTTSTNPDGLPSNAYCSPLQNWQDSWRSLEDQVLTLVNQQRAAGASCGAKVYPPGAVALKVDGALRCAARAHSKDMVDRDFFGHVNPSNEGPGERAAKAGTSWSGENVAAGYSSAQAVMDGWMKSDGHCNNIMNPSSKRLGVGYYPGGDWGHNWTQVFGW